MSGRTDERTDERGGRTARKYNAFADVVAWRRRDNRIAYSVFLAVEMYYSQFMHGDKRLNESQ